MKLPSYANKLIALRRGGAPLLEVNLVWGNRWDVVPEPKICVKPADYQRGALDWRCVAGLKVNVLDQSPALESVRTAAVQDFYWMLGEIAQRAAVVMVVWDTLDVQDIAFDARELRDGEMSYPEWWPDTVRRGYQHRQRAWYDDAARAANLPPKRRRVASR